MAPAAPRTRTALCLTPDRNWFPAAVFAAAQVLAQPDAGALDVFIVGTLRDMAPEFFALPDDLRGRIHLLAADFDRLDTAVPGVAGLVLRRLFLDAVLPPDYTRIVTMDADMLVIAPGLARLAEIDSKGAPLAAATDMIFLKQFGGGALAERFSAYRAGLGLAPQTPYFNAGLMVIDRAAFAHEKLGERTLEFLRANRGLCRFAEQSALNALLQGRAAPLSPRYNFMGDFFLLGLMQEIAPTVLHFVNRPKPWEGVSGFGGAEFARIYRNWFDASPWPGFGRGAAEISDAAGSDIADVAAFRRRLMDYLRSQDFADGPLKFLPVPTSHKRL